MKHTFKNGQQVIMTCRHPVKFIDDSMYEGCDTVPALRVDRVHGEKSPKTIGGLPVKSAKLVIPRETIDELIELSKHGLPVVISTLLRDALEKHRGIRFTNLYTLGQTSVRGGNKLEQVCSWLEPANALVSYNEGEIVPGEISWDNEDDFVDFVRDEYNIPYGDEVKFNDFVVPVGMTVYLEGRSVVGSSNPLNGNLNSGGNVPVAAKNNLKIGE